MARLPCSSTLLTLFPGIFDSYLKQSLLEDAIQAGVGASPRRGTSATGRKTNTTVWMIGPSAAVPAWCLMAQPVVDCVEAVSGESGTAR